MPIGESKIQYEIKVVEGNRGYVKGIRFIGIDLEYAPELSKRLETKEKWFFSPITGRGRLSMGLVELDENNINVSGGIPIAIPEARRAIPKVLTTSFNHGKL